MEIKNSSRMFKLKEGRVLGRNQKGFRIKLLFYYLIQPHLLTKVDNGWIIDLINFDERKIVYPSIYQIAV